MRNQPVERWLLSSFAFCLFAFYAGLYLEGIYRFNLSVRQEQQALLDKADDKPTIIVSGQSVGMPAGLHLLTLPIFLATVLARRYSIALVLSIAYASLFSISLVVRSREVNSYAFHVLDWSGLVAIVTLIIWVGSAFWRCRRTIGNLA